ncbi:MAG: GNAT family N-acetyltransferase [Clostridiaceae bacterium]|nr:GNAT family N-acetyltransferase [Clostridiaceae bacterium]
MFLRPPTGLKSVFELTSERLFLSVLSPSSAERVSDYLVRNRSFHEPFHQIHDNSYFLPSTQRRYLRADMDGFLAGSQCPFWIIKQSDPSLIVGRLAFSSLIRGALQSCLMGYHLDRKEEGKGYMTEAILCACDYMFNTWKIHRIQADIMPENQRSVHTIERCGFKYSGTNEKYMAINGQWRDHATYALLNDEYFNPDIIR